jgi:hypothetical protein
MSNEIRLEKVENGYIVRCFSGHGNESRDETFVYNTFYDVAMFAASEFNENGFAQVLNHAQDVENLKDVDV